MSQAPFEKCPQFESCSAPSCPLDPAADSRTVLSGEPKCNAQRRTRVSIAAACPDLLPGGGLTAREKARDARRARWLALPDEERARRLANLSGSLPPSKMTQNPRQRDASRSDRKGA